MSDKPPGYVFGRPTKYRSEMCEQVIEWGRLGKSRTWMAAELNVDRDTIDLWAKAHPDFMRSLTRAKALEQQWWEDKGQECLIMDSGQTFAQSMWGRSMAARFPDEWREKTEQEITGKDGTPVVPTVHVTITRPKS